MHTIHNLDMRARSDSDHKIIKSICVLTETIALLKRTQKQSLAKRIPPNKRVQKKRTQQSLHLLQYENRTKACVTVHLCTTYHRLTLRHRRSS